MSSLLNSLTSFKEEFNSNNNLDKLLKGWSPNIIINNSTSDEEFTIQINDNKISISEGKQSSDHQIIIEAEEDILTDVFTGKANPSEVVLDGLMEVYGDDSDQIKLDAITLVIWGM